MQNKFKPLNDEYQDTVLSFTTSMFKVGELIAEVRKVWRNNGLNILRNTLVNRGDIPSNSEEWRNQGVSCEILKPGNKSWKKGKIRINISFEFCPDEVEIEEITQCNDAEINQAISPLDDIRQMMNQNS